MEDVHKSFKKYSNSYRTAIPAATYKPLFGHYGVLQKGLGEKKKKIKKIIRISRSLVPQLLTSADFCSLFWKHPEVACLDSTLSEH